MCNQGPTLSPITPPGREDEGGNKQYNKKRSHFYTEGLQQQLVIQTSLKEIPP